MGFQALNANTASGNVAVGYQALRANTTGIRNTAEGFQALLKNTTGLGNTANGLTAFYNNTSGIANTAFGVYALWLSFSGSQNIALGEFAGEAVSSGTNNIYIGNAGISTNSNTIRIGTSAAFTDSVGISHPKHPVFVGVTTANAAIPVLIDTVGQLGTTSSSRRFKKEIKPMDKASETILGLKPVTFHYKSDTTETPQFGLIAEEVTGVNPGLVVRDENGEIYTVRYDAVNAMLLNEFLKEHRKVQEQGRKAQEQEATNTQLKKGMEVLTAQLKEQAAQIQKVSAQLEAGKPAPRMVINIYLR